MTMREIGEAQREMGRVQEQEQQEEQQEERVRQLDCSAINFRCLVKECAREPQIVAAFNRAYGAALQAPIVALLDGRWPTSVSAEEELQIGCFIVFVHDQIWRRLKRVQARMERALRMR